MPLWLTRAIRFLAELFLGPVIAREAGKTEAEADQLKKTVERKDEHLEIAARPHADRDDLLRRMRDGDL